MRLYIMRHGPAEDQAPTGRDADRALTEKGRERVREVARALAKLGEAPHAIVTSPLVRAVQTAEIVEAEVKLAVPVEVRRELGMGGRASSLVEELVAAGRKRTMLVGHEPDLSDLVTSLTGVGVEMQKAMVVGVSFHEGRDAELAFILDPKSLQVR